MKDVSGLLLMMIGVLMMIVDVFSLCGDPDCRNKRALSAAANDDDKLLSEESVGEVWFEL